MDVSIFFLTMGEKVTNDLRIVKVQRKLAFGKLTATQHFLARSDLYMLIFSFKMLPEKIIKVLKGWEDPGNQILYLLCGMTAPTARWQGPGGRGGEAATGLLRSVRRTPRGLCVSTHPFLALPSVGRNSTPQILSGRHNTDMSFSSPRDSGGHPRISDLNTNKHNMEKIFLKNV